MSRLNNHFSNILLKQRPRLRSNYHVGDIVQFFFSLSVPFRNFSLLRGRHVSRLEKSRVTRRQFANTVHDSDVHDPRDSEMVHFQGEGEKSAKIVAMAARQGHRHQRRTVRRTKVTRRERTKRFAGRADGSLQEE